MDKEYHVKLDSFEGPLDLLLHLIEKRKLHINDISLANITDEYLSYIGKLNEFPIRDAAHFILVASTLVLIKSRSLLPILTLTEEEEEDVEELEKRLRIYKLIKEASKEVDVCFGDRIIFYREASNDFMAIFSPTKEISLSSSLDAIRNVIRKLPKKEAIPQLIIEKVVSLEEMIGNLTERLTATLNMSFREFTGKERGDKISVVVSFLAMLELIKRGVINAKQDGHFEDIVMKHANNAR